MIKLSIAHKLSIGAVLLVLSSAGMVGGLFYNKTTHLLIEKSAQTIADEINNAATRLQIDINTQIDDTLFLSHTPPLQGMLRALKTQNYDKLGDSTYQQWKLRLQDIFSNLLKTKPSYLKARIIDNNGQEVIVVNKTNNQIIILADNQLQNKAHRDYVKNTLKLKKEEVYLSEINLNREHGKVSTPHQEILRSAVPIYDEENGKITGLLIISAEIGHTFRRIQNDAKNENNKVYITNDHGGYLLHPNKKRAYGFDLGKHYRIQEDFPEISPMYLPGNKKSKFIKIPKHSEDQYVLKLTKIPFDRSRPERFIAVAITEQYSTIVNAQKSVLRDIVITSSILALSVMLLAILFAYKLAQPIKQITQVMDDYTHHRKNSTTMPITRKDEIGVLARSYESLIAEVKNGQKNLENLNKNLSTMVAERTMELEENEAQQRAIVKSMAEGLITSDRYGNISTLNAAAEIIFGYKQNEVIGKNLSVLMPTSIASQHDKYLKNYHQTGAKFLINTRKEMEGQRKNGDIFPIELAINEVLVNDKQIFTAVIRDITEQKEMDKMKNEFVSNVSHELRTPLTAIRGSLGLIDGGALGEIPEQAADLIHLANKNTNRLLLLINDILDIQKIESGEMDFNFTAVEITPFLQQVIAENKAYGDQYGVSFIISENSENSEIYADYFRMMQVLANLLSNAVKFSPKGSTVKICVTENKNHAVLISVIDHGEGIPLKFQPRLFDKFTQSNSASTRQTGSSGLGLSITKMIVENHGGDLTFVSEEGKGTTFTITLPDVATATKMLSKNSTPKT